MPRKKSSLTEERKQTAAKRKLESKKEQEPSNNANNNNNAAKKQKIFISLPTNVSPQILNSFPKELKAFIASFLDRKSIGRLSGVNKSWRDLFWTHDKLAQPLSKNTVSKLTKPLPESIHNLSKIEWQIIQKLVQLGLEPEVFSVWIKGFEDTAALKIFAEIVNHALIALDYFQKEQGKITDNQRKDYYAKRLNEIDFIADYLAIDLPDLDISAISSTNLQKLEQLKENIAYVKEKLPELADKIETIYQHDENQSYSKKSFHKNECKLFILEQLRESGIAIDYKKVFAKTNPFVLFMLALLRDIYSNNPKNITWLVALATIASGSLKVTRYLKLPKNENALIDDGFSLPNEALELWIKQHIADPAKLEKIEVIKSIIADTLPEISTPEILKVLKETPADQLKDIYQSINVIKKKPWVGRFIVDNKINYSELLKCNEVAIRVVHLKNTQEYQTTFLQIITKSKELFSIIFRRARSNQQSLTKFASENREALAVLYEKTLEDLKRMTTDEMDGFFQNQKNSSEQIAEAKLSKVYGKLADKYFPIGKTKRKQPQNRAFYELVRVLDKNNPKLFLKLLKIDKKNGSYLKFILDSNSFKPELIDLKEFEAVISQPMLLNLADLDISLSLPGEIGTSLQLKMVQFFTALNDVQGEKQISLYRLIKENQLPIVGQEFARHIFNLVNRGQKDGGDYVEDFVEFLNSIQLVSNLQKILKKIEQTKVTSIEKDALLKSITEQMQKAYDHVSKLFGNEDLLQSDDSAHESTASIASSPSYLSATEAMQILSPVSISPSDSLADLEQDMPIDGRAQYLPIYQPHIEEIQSNDGLSTELTNESSVDVESWMSCIQ